MPDTKITALTAIGANPIIPSTFPIPMVDLTDTSMAASGTTKKVTVNQILGAGGTATLASATITGDLTVDTSTLKVDSANNFVAIGTVSGFNLAAGRGNLTVGGSSSAIINISTASADSGNLFHDGTEMFLINRTASGPLSFQTNLTTRYSISSTGIATWSNVGGVAGTAMTLNATGLGVGGSPVNFPNYTTIHAIGKTTTTGGVFQTSTSNNSTAARFACSSASVDLFVETNHPLAFYTNATEKMRIKQAGQVRFVPLAADPAGAEAGDVYYNSTSNKLKCYNGTTWNDLF